jgi:hypothetical protein
MGVREDRGARIVARQAGFTAWRVDLPCGLGCKLGGHNGVDAVQRVARAAGDAVEEAAADPVADGRGLYAAGLGRE